MGWERRPRQPRLAVMVPLMSVSCTEVSSKMSFENNGSVPKIKPNHLKKTLLGNGQSGLFQLSWKKAASHLPLQSLKNNTNPTCSQLMRQPTSSPAICPDSKGTTVTTTK